MPALLPVPCKGKDEALPCLLRGDQCLPKAEPYPNAYFIIITAASAASPVEAVLSCLLMVSELQTTTSAKDWKVLFPYEAPMAACRQLGYFLWSVGSGISPPKCTQLLCREPLPGKWEDGLDPFQKLLVLRCLRGDKITNAMQDFVVLHLDQRFIEPQVTSQEQELVGTGMEQEASSL